MGWRILEENKNEVIQYSYCINISSDIYSVLKVWRRDKGLLTDFYKVKTYKPGKEPKNNEELTKELRKLVKKAR